MRRLLFQSDDYGISPAVSDGIIHGIDHGIIRNTGIFINMDDAEESVLKIINKDVCLGIDINLVAGKPVSEPNLIPNLVDKRGNFINSRERIKNNEVVSVEVFITTFKCDPYPYLETVIEVESQIKKSIDVVGKKPVYLHLHSLVTPNIVKATREMSYKYSIYFSLDMMYHPQIKQLPGTIELQKNISLEEQLSTPVIEDFLNKAIVTLNTNETGYYICHCGFVDAILMKNSSLTLRRIKDLELATDKSVKDYLLKEQIELITYYDLLEQEI